MTRPPKIRRGLGCAALTAASLWAAFVSSAWHYRKPISLTPGETLAVVKLDREVYSHSAADLADLRILRDNEEVPYVIESLGATSRETEHATAILDQSIMPGVGLQFALRLPTSLRHNRIRLATPERNFRRTVRIETSENGRNWSVARTDGAIFDFSQGDRQLSSLWISYPVSTRRFVRVTVLGWNKINTVTAAYLQYTEERPASWETVATVMPTISEDAATQSTLLTMDLGVPGLPVDSIRVETDSRSFHRAVGVEASVDGTDWRYVTQGVIARLPGEETLAIQIPETRNRYLRLRIYNQDDRPLSFGEVELQAVIRHIKFIPTTPGQYWLYYGNPSARSPSYDLPILLARRERVAQTDWPAGKQEPNPDYRPPTQPWSEQHPSILYTVLGVAVLGLGAATLRFALGMRRPS
jgi:Protein of unknown function (DUF3999)